MSDEYKAPPQAAIVRRIESVVNTWGHVIEEGVDWPLALYREYWGRVVQKFRPGDRVEIHSFDHRIQFTMLVLDVNTSANPIYLDIAFLPVWPVDIRLPIPAPQREPRYIVRQAPGSSGFRVIDTSSGEPVHPNSKDRFSALEMAAELNRGLESSAAQMAAGLDARDPERSPGAERTARYRQRQRAAGAT